MTCIPGLAQHGAAIFAHEQLAGKGQRGKYWIAEKDANILLSIVVKPRPLQLAQQFQLSACVAVALHDFFMKYAGDNSKIKWPNDLYWQDRKAGGILVESVVRSEGALAGADLAPGQWDWAIIGIGVNINQPSFPSNLPNPVSLKQITGKDFRVVSLAKELCTVLENYLQQLITSGFENIYSKYISNLYKKGSVIKLKMGNRVFEATLKTVSPLGKLIVQHALEEEFDFGEVEWII